MIAARLHLPEQDICIQPFRHKIRRVDRVLHNAFAALIEQTEILFYIEDADDIIHRFAADGVARMAAFANGLFPLRVVFVQPQSRNLSAVCAKLTDRQVVKLKNVLYHFLFRNVDDALLAADIDHHTNFFLADLFVLGVGVNAQKPQHGVCRNGQHPDDGGKEL